MGLAQRLRKWFEDHPAVYQWGLPLLLLAIYAPVYYYLSESAWTPVGVLIILPVLVSVWLVGQYAWVIFFLGLSTP
jgi:hypothetical protein